MVDARGIDLDVEGAGRGVAEISGAQVEHPIGEPESTDEALGPGQQFGVQRCSLLGHGVGQDLDLVELMHPQQTAGVASSRAGLATEACRLGHESHGQLGGIENLVSGQGGERHLGGGDGPEVVALQAVRIIGELGKVTGADHGLGEHNGRRAHLFERVAVVIEGQLTQRSRQRRAGTAEHGEHGTGHLDGALEIEDAEFRADVPMRDALMVGPCCGIVAGADTLDLDIVFGMRTIRGIGRGKVGDVQQKLAGSSSNVIGDIGELLLTFAQGATLGLLRLGLLSATIASKRPDLLGDGIHLGADLITFGGDLAQLGIQGAHGFELVETPTPSGQCLAHCVMVGSDPAYIDHGSEPYSSAR